MIGELLRTLRGALLERRVLYNYSDITVSTSSGVLKLDSVHAKGNIITKSVTRWSSSDSANVAGETCCPTCMVCSCYSHARQKPGTQGWRCCL